ncbi:MAG: SDR family NAD(P)-dependent oxidoreductase [Acidobacteria bacterium]|nr:SDR family NAD(P)-dependent oxidoreductase [Acidobacteriota bacterium]
MCRPSQFSSSDHTLGSYDLIVITFNAWGGYEQYEHDQFAAPLWKQPVRHWEGMFTAGVRPTLLTTREAIRLMLPHQKGLIVNVVAWDHDKYLGNVFYDTAKHAINRITFGTSRDLKPYSIAVLSVAPGFMRTERVQAAVGNHEGFDWSQTESPEYVGRVIAALAVDPQLQSRSGKVFMAGELAAEFQVTDIDGRYVPPFLIPEPE